MVVAWVVVVLLSDATEATAARAIPIDTMAAVDRPAAGAAAAAGAAGAAGACSAGVAGADCANAWPDTRAMMASTEIAFFIVNSFSLIETCQI